MRCVSEQLSGSVRFLQNLDVRRTFLIWCMALNMLDMLLQMTLLITEAHAVPLPNDERMESRHDYAVIGVVAGVCWLMDSVQWEIYLSREIWSSRFSRCSKPSLMLSQ